MKTVITLIVICFSFLGKPEANSHQKIIREFLKTVAGEDFNNNHFKRSFIIPINDKADSSKRNEFLDFQLANLHRELAGKDLNKLTITAYSRLPKNEQNVTLYDIKPNEKSYVIKYQGMYLTTVLFKKDLIKSFSVMGKGGAKTFLVF